MMKDFTPNDIVLDYGLPKALRDVILGGAGCRSDCFGAVGVGSAVAYYR